MSSLAVMQPHYLPWAGYFNLMSRADDFVFLDNVKFQKSSWHTRNRIMLNKQEHMLTIATRGSRIQDIRDVEVNDESGWRRKHVKSLRQAYGKASHGKNILDTVTPIIEDTAKTKLQDISISIILAISSQLDIRCNTQRSSDIETTGKRSDRLVDMCRHFEATRYLSPQGAKQYIEDDGRFKEANIEVEYQQFEPGAYDQNGGPDFVGSLSMVDVVANLGWEQAKDYLRSTPD